MSDTTTWRDIEERARFCPVLQRLVISDIHELASREELLMMTVLFLSREREQLMQQEIESTDARDLVVRKPRPRCPVCGTSREVRYLSHGEPLCHECWRWVIACFRRWKGRMR